MKFWLQILSSSSSICHAVGPLVGPFRSHASRSLFNGLPWFLLPVGECCFITLGNLLRGILFTWCIQFLLYFIKSSYTVFKVYYISQHLHLELRWDHFHNINGSVRFTSYYEYVLSLKMAFIAETCCWCLLIDKVVYRLHLNLFYYYYYYYPCYDLYAGNLQFYTWNKPCF